MASPEDTELSWEAYSKAKEEGLEKATESLDVAGNSENSSPYLQRIVTWWARILESIQLINIVARNTVLIRFLELPTAQV
ncbi:hypothetical protein PG996_006005 [Apiospora saccharicola]|uniref:Uncharacterized protein n=1 Tax=Apiospora saccharicola TaxID=335842 RepID=A0ABR1VNA9_9PEZI